MDFFRKLFEPPLTVQERVKEMQKTLEKQMREIDREIRKIENESVSTIAGNGSPGIFLFIVIIRCT